MNPQEQLLDLLVGFWRSRVLHVAACLNLSDLLADGPKTLDELASASGTHAPSLFRLMRAAISFSLYSRDADGRYSNTPLGETLRSDKPGSLRSLILSEFGESHYRAWEQLTHSVQTGDVAFHKVFEMPIWEYFARHPERAQVFNQSMTDLTRTVEAAILAAYDFSPYSTIVDVGGGHGSLLAGMLEAAPDAKGILFDAPLVVEGAKPLFERRGLTERASTVGGSFFESVPEGGDLYTMKWIIHDWDDEKSVEILSACRRAMSDHARLLIMEFVLPEDDQPHFAKFLDLNMMVMVGGRERTSAEFEALFAKSGLETVRVIQTPGPIGIVEAKPRLERTKDEG